MREQDCREEDEHDEAGCQIQKDLGGQSHCLIRDTRLGRYRFFGGIIGA